MDKLEIYNFSKVLCSKIPFIGRKVQKVTFFFPFALFPRSVKEKEVETTL